MLLENACLIIELETFEKLDQSTLTFINEQSEKNDNNYRYTELIRLNRCPLSYQLKKIGFNFMCQH